MKKMHKTASIGLTLALLSHTSLGAAGAALGPYDRASFTVTTGSCRDCKALPQALWYFPQEAIALPHAGQGDGPPLVWLGGAQPFDNARLDHQGGLTVAGQPVAWELTPRLATNRSWFNQDSQRFFAAHPLAGRADVLPDGRLRVRSFWPADFNLNNAPLQPLAHGETLQQLVRITQGGPQSTFRTRVLWQRTPGAAWQPGASVFGLMLNGAQGDDDEAHGGHFALMTGRLQADGQMRDWLVNNFYNLDAVSEKGIIAAATPLDSYLAELNSGQQWYRPSWMLVAVMRDGSPVSSTVQQALNAQLTRFYRHDVRYDHVHSNCTGLSVDAVKGLGWQVPQQGPSSRLKSVPAWFYVAATDRDLTSARKIYDYLNEEQTRLYPAVAFDVMGQDLLQLVQGTTGRELQPFEKELANAVDALVWVQVPQFPSSRKWGQAPVWSLDEYRARTPADRSQWQIVPVGPRPFPEQWNPPAAARSALVPWPVWAVLLSPFAALALWWRRRRARRD